MGSGSLRGAKPRQYAIAIEFRANRRLQRVEEVAVHPLSSEGTVVAKRRRTKPMFDSTDLETQLVKKGVDRAYPLTLGGVLMKSSLAVFAFAGLLSISGTAHAVEMVTPFVFANGSANGSTVFVSCIATNGGKKPATIIISARDQAGNPVGARSNVCPDEVPAGGTCYASFDENQGVSCRFEGPGKMRAHAEIMEWLGAELVGIVQATK
jgi:hypothetical protein